jgi:TPR repeat protein
MIGRRCKQRRMKKESRRPLLSLVIIVVSTVTVYCVSWRFDPARLEVRAMKGQAEAQYRLGKAYFDGYILQKNNREAVNWLRKAADQGYAKAQTGLGVMYARGLGVPQDRVQAAKWFRKAADQGLAVAQNQLGVLYAEGKGIERNWDEAVVWFEKAAAQGYKTPQLNLMLARIARSGTVPRLETRNGKVYASAKVSRVDRDGMTVLYTPENGGVGVANVKFDALSNKLQGDYGVDLNKRAGSEPEFSKLVCLATQPL